MFSLIFLNINFPKSCNFVMMLPLIGNLLLRHGDVYRFDTSSYLVLNHLRKPRSAWTSILNWLGSKVDVM